MCCFYRKNIHKISNNCFTDFLKWFFWKILKKLPSKSIIIRPKGGSSRLVFHINLCRYHGKTSTNITQLFYRLFKMIFLLTWRIFLGRHSVRLWLDLSFCIRLQTWNLGNLEGLHWNNTCIIMHCFKFKTRPPAHGVPSTVYIGFLWYTVSTLTMHD